jgi:hypothetical protein
MTKNDETDSNASTRAFKTVQSHRHADLREMKLEVNAVKTERECTRTKTPGEIEYTFKIFSIEHDKRSSERVLRRNYLKQ